MTILDHSVQRLKITRFWLKHRAKVVGRPPQVDAAINHYIEAWVVPEERMRERFGGQTKLRKQN